MFSTALFSSRTSAKHQLLLREAVAAVKNGDRGVARTLLREIIHGDPRNEQAWLWMAGVAESVAEVTHCLEKVIEIQPENQMANERLSMLRLLQYAGSDGSNPPKLVEQEAPSAALSVRGSTLNGTTQKPKLPVRPLTPLCSLCQGDIDPRRQQCTRCGVLSTLRSLQDIFANRSTDLALIKTGIERWRQERDRGVTFDNTMALVYGHLATHDFRTALEFLREASRLSPDRKDLFEAIDKLDRCPAVLVVDDSATIRHLVAHTLLAAGYIVYMAEDGVKGLAMLQELTPDMIFLDITMPRMDGYQVCKVVKGDESTKKIPVVMLSGKDGFFDKVKGRLAGSAEYLTKPFEAESLVRTVEKHIPAHKRGGVDRQLTGR